MKKYFIAAAVALSFTGAAIADPIYIDLDQNGSLTTAIAQLDAAYDSHTVVNMSTSSVSTFAGVDLIGNTMSGLALGGVFSDFSSLIWDGSAYQNIINSTPGGLLFENISSNSILSFGVSLTGTFSVSTGITYNSGTLSLYSSNVGSYGAPTVTNSFTKLLSADFVSGGLTVGNQSVLNVVNNSAQVFVDDAMFIDQNGTPVSFEDYLIADPLNQIRMTINQNVFGGAAKLFSALSGNVADGFKGTDGTSVYVSAGHSASIVTEVPEPTTIAILGLGLLGLAGASRRKS